MSEEDLYDLYCKFMDRSKEVILPTLTQEGSKEYFEEIHVTRPRPEFEKMLREMQPPIRTRYIRRLREGYDVATVIEGYDFSNIDRSGSQGRGI